MKHIEVITEDHVVTQLRSEIEFNILFLMNRISGLVGGTGEVDPVLQPLAKAVMDPAVQLELLNRLHDRGYSPDVIHEAYRREMCVNQDID